MTPTLLTALQRFHDEGSQFRIDAFWDAGFDVSRSAETSWNFEQYPSINAAVRAILPSRAPAMAPDDPLKALQQLYDSEVNFTLIASADGVQAQLGDGWSGYTWRGTFRTIEQAIHTLAEQTQKRIPNSRFAKGGSQFNQRLRKNVSSTSQKLNRQTSNGVPVDEVPQIP